MEILDSAVMLLIPGAMESGFGSLLFRGALSFAPAVAFVVALPALDLPVGGMHNEVVTYTPKRYPS